MAAASVISPAGWEPINQYHCTYTACYCEENVYHLLKHLIEARGRPAQSLFAVFISNSNETVPFWHQQASQRPDGLVVWDYHVVVLEVHDQQQHQHQQQGQHHQQQQHQHQQHQHQQLHHYHHQQQQQQPAARVWDLDTLLPFPCTFLQYVQQALQADSILLTPQYERRYRIVAAGTFLRGFASDRSHMRRPDGSWSAPPPSYPCIVARDGCTNNLHCYRVMSADTLDDATAADVGNGSICQGAGSCTTTAAGWQNISSLASSRLYGVVLREQQLLDALLRQ